MQKSQWSVVILLVLVTSAVFVIRRIQRAKQPALPNLLMIGTSADYPPFSFKKDGNIIGLDIELAKMIAKKLELPYQIKDTPFPLLFSNLQEGKLHLVAAGISADPSRRHQATFTTPYVTQDPLVIIVPQQSPIKKIKDISNKRVTVNQGYTADMYISQLPNISIYRTETIEDSIQQLHNEEVDAFVTNLNTVTPIFDQYGAENFRAITIQDTDENIALALSPLYPDLAARIQSILDQFMRDGSLDQLRAKWHVQ